jgi:hypothetical protein
VSRRTRCNAGFFVIGALAIFLNLRGGGFERGILMRLILSLDWIGLVLFAEDGMGVYGFIAWSRPDWHRKIFFKL